MTSQEMKKTLWEAADKLRAQMDAAEYKHLVLGLIFLKYVSDAFEERRREIPELVADQGIPMSCEIRSNGRKIWTVWPVFVSALLKRICQ
jgi:type I restriction-modification system DNA methylase subunit